MKSYLKTLEKLKEKIAKDFAKRDQYYTSKDEKWQDSDKGIAYDVDTSLLTDVASNVNEAIANMKLILKE